MFQDIGKLRPLKILQHMLDLWTHMVIAKQNEFYSIKIFKIFCALEDL